MKILIADQMHPSLFAMLDSQGWIYDYRPDFRRNDIISCLADYDGLIIRSKTRIDEELLTQATDLRFIARAGAGLDLIDDAATQRLGITLFHAGTGNRDAVAEHTVGMLLMLFNNLSRSDREVRQAIWDREGNRGVELMGKTVGLIGYGNNGTATAQRLSGFGCRVLAYDPYPNEMLRQQGVAYVPIEELFREADVVSLHCPLTPENHHLINADSLRQMKDGVMLINTSRGALINTSDVVTALKRGRIGYFGMDVYEEEDGLFFEDHSGDILQDDIIARLMTFQNVLITSHQGFLTSTALQDIAETTIYNLTCFEKNTICENELKLMNAY